METLSTRFQTLIRLAILQKTLIFCTRVNFKFYGDFKCPINIQGHLFKIDYFTMATSQLATIADLNKKKLIKIFLKIHKKNFSWSKEIFDSYTRLYTILHTI